MIPMPDGLQFLVPTKIAPILTTPLLSWSTKVRMGLRVVPPAARRARVPIARSPNSSPIITGRRRSIISPSRCLPASTAAPPKSSASRACCRALSSSRRNTAACRAGILAGAPRAASAPPQPLFRTLKGGLGSLIDALSAVHRAKRESRSTARSRRSSDRRSGYRLRVSGDWIDSGPRGAGLRVARVGASWRPQSIRSCRNTWPASPTPPRP